jgi:hypothetical protein
MTGSCAPAYRGGVPDRFDQLPKAFRCVASVRPLTCLTISGLEGCEVLRAHLRESCRSTPASDEVVSFSGGGPAREGVGRRDRPSYFFESRSLTCA